MRRARGFTQADLSRRAGVSRQEISNFERGHRRNARVLTVQALADALEVTTSQLAAGGPVHGVTVVAVPDLLDHLGKTINKIRRFRWFPSLAAFEEGTGIRGSHLKAIEEGRVDLTLGTLEAIASAVREDGGGLIRGAELHAQGRREILEFIKVWGDRREIRIDLL